MAVLFSIEAEVEVELRQADFGVFVRVSGFSEGRITSTAVPQIVVR